jgi:hypothetical protein
MARPEYMAKALPLELFCLVRPLKQAHVTDKFMNIILLILYYFRCHIQFLRPVGCIKGLYYMTHFSMVNIDPISRDGRKN